MDNLKLFTFRINNSHANCLLYKDAELAWQKFCNKNLSIIDPIFYIKQAVYTKQPYLNYNDCDFLPCFHTDPLRFKIAQQSEHSIYTDSDIIIRGDIVAEIEHVLAVNPDIHFIGTSHLFFAKKDSPVLKYAIEYFSNPKFIETNKCNDLSAFDWAIGKLSTEEKANIQLGWKADYIHYSGTNFIPAKRIQFIQIVTPIQDWEPITTCDAFNRNPQDLETVFIFSTETSLNCPVKQFDNNCSAFIRNYNNHIGAWSQRFFIEQEDDVKTLKKYLFNICETHGTDYCGAAMSIWQCMRTKYGKQLIELFGSEGINSIFRLI